MKIVIAIAQEPSERQDVRDVQRNRDSVVRALAQDGFATEVLSVTKEDFSPHTGIVKKLAAARPECVFNLFEGFSDAPQYEAAFVSVLEKLGIRFTGNSSYALRHCLDKARTLSLLTRAGVPVPRAQVFRRGTGRVRQKLKGMQFPVFVKPCAEDASVGIDEQSLVMLPEQAEAVIVHKLQASPAGVIVEEFIPGVEYTVGFTGDFPYEDLGIASIDFGKFPAFAPFLTYRSKWDIRAAEFKKIIPLPAVLEPAQESRVLSWARQAGAALRCSGYFRVDLRERGGEIFVLDVNPNPDLNEDSGFVRQAYARGFRYSDLVLKIVDSARSRATR